MPLPSLPGESYTPQAEPSVEPLKSSLATRLVQPYRPAAVPSEPVEALGEGVGDIEGADAVVSLGEVDGLGGVVSLGEVDGLGGVVALGEVDGLGAVAGLGAGDEDVGTGEGQSSFWSFGRGGFWGFEGRQPPYPPVVDERGDTSAAVDGDDAKKVLIVTSPTDTKASPCLLGTS
jgi:hypothetical protein